MTTKRLVRIAFFTMLTIVGGLIRIPIPFTPIKFTLQTFFVIASGFVIGGKDGAFAQIAYALLGLIGLPIFSDGTGGFAYVIRPSFGYILSFPLAAFTAGKLCARLRKKNIWLLFACGMAGVLVNYAIGIAYQVAALCLWSHLSLVAALATVPSVLLMLVKDAVLVWLLCLCYPRIMTTIGKWDEQNKPVVSEPEQDLPDPPPPPKEPKDKEKKPQAEPV